jgi:nitroreductase
MRGVPILVVLFYRLQENLSRELVLGSVWMAVENMLLAATDEGLGSCVYTFLNRNEENKLKHVLKTGQRDRIACIVQLGYTETEPIPPCRKQLSEIVSYEHF